MLNAALEVVALGDVNTTDIEYLAQELQAKFGSCTVGDKMDMPAGAYSPVRQQYMASLVIQKLLEAYPATEADTKLLGVTQADLFAPGLEYVVGQAEGHVAIISLLRLAVGNAVEVFRCRMLKEAVHELGHTMGLRHCPDTLCIMHYSRFIRDIDAKKDWFCSRCLSSYAISVQK